MKIRHKQTGDVVEGILHDPYCLWKGESFPYVQILGGGKMTLYSGYDYEPVPEEVWEDVTESCHVAVFLSVLFQMFAAIFARAPGIVGRDGIRPVYRDRIMYDSAGDPVCTIHNGYRLRKVSQLGGRKWVFLIERKGTA